MERVSRRISTFTKRCGTSLAGRHEYSGTARHRVGDAPFKGEVNLRQRWPAGDRCFGGAIRLISVRTALISFVSSF